MDATRRAQIRTRLNIIEAANTIRRYTWENDYFRDRLAAFGLPLGETPFFLDTAQPTEAGVIFGFNIDEPLDWKNPPPITREIAQECIEVAKTRCPEFQSYLRDHPTATMLVEFLHGATPMTPEELDELDNA